MNDSHTLLLEKSEGRKAVAAAIRRDPSHLPSLALILGAAACPGLA